MTASFLALLGQTVDCYSRIDVYNACLVELQQEHRRYTPDEINAAIRLARKDLRSFESTLQQDVLDLALRFFSFIFSTEDLVRDVSDQIVLGVFKDVLYVLAKAEGKSCALAAVIISLEIVSCKRTNLIKRAALSLVPSLADCIAIRFPTVDIVVKEVILAIGRLCRVVPDTMHALRCSWAHCVLPIALNSPHAEIQDQAIICLEAVRPSSCLIGKELHKVIVAELNEAQLARMRQLASEVDISPSVPSIWAVCIRCLGIFVFGNLRLWNELACIWKKCFSHRKPDIAIACLNSWSVVIDAATSNPTKLHDMRLMKLIVRPFKFIFDYEKPDRVQVSVRMKAVDIWSKFLNIVKCHKITGEIFQEIICPVLMKMLLSVESAVMIASCSLLGSFFSTSRDSLLLGSQQSFSLHNSQLIYEFPTERDQADYFCEIYPHFIPLFRVLLNHRKLSLEVTELEFSTIKNSWRLFLSSLSLLDINVVKSVINELVMTDLEIGRNPGCLQYIECIFAVIPPSVWFGEDHTHVIESPTGRLCRQYLAAFTEGQPVRNLEFRLCEEWSKFTIALSSACRQHNVDHRLVKLSTGLLEPIFRNEKKLSHQNAFAFINLARVTCATIFQHSPVKYNVRYFHAVCIDLLHTVLTSKDINVNTVVSSCFQQQVQRFALFLYRSIIANEAFPANAALLKEYEKALLASLQACPTLRVFTCKFLEQAFGITPFSIPDNIICSQELRQAVVATRSIGNGLDSTLRSANSDQEAFDSWKALYESFDSATEKLLSAPIRADLRNRVLERIMEQRIYFDGLLSISSELCNTKQR